MNIRDIIKNKKFKSVLITLGEIIIVAGLIFGVLMYIQSKINKDASQSGNISNKTASQKQEEKLSNNYYIIANKKKSAIIIYQYAEDKKSKKVVKVFSASIGSKIKNGEFKTTIKYSWTENEKTWHHSNVGFSKNYWLQSVSYRDKYSYTMSKASYRAIGNKQSTKKSILMYSSDAQWIYNHLKTGTKINIIKGNKKDRLPKTIQPIQKLVKGCGWDPTDTSKDNPYKKTKNSAIVTGKNTVYVEKGNNPQYISNIIAKDLKGRNVTQKLKYNEIDTSTVGKKVVKYTYKPKSGKKIKGKLSFKVIDTTPPEIIVSNLEFELKLDSLEKKKFRTENTRNEIIKNAKKYVSCNESGVVISITCPEVEELMGSIDSDKNENIVTITAIDSSKNVSTEHIVCRITLTDKAKKEIEDSKKNKN